MKKQKLSKLLILLFESKLKKYTAITIDTWIELVCFKNYPDELIEDAIKKIVYEEGDFISIKMINDKIVELAKEHNKYCQIEFEKMRGELYNNTELWEKHSKKDDFNETTVIHELLLEKGITIKYYVIADFDRKENQVLIA